jgi:6-pyruvoyltetrahydropterin/6-carboxytetrahydropterin synthase
LICIESVVEAMFCILTLLHFSVYYFSVFISMVYITRIEHFNAAHRVFNPTWSDEKNSAVFGRCANKNYHGHNFELIVTVKGKVDIETGFVMDLKVLGDIVRREVVDKVDHQNLNLDVDFMANIIPSCENFIVEIWNIIAPLIETAAPNSRLHALKLVETPKNYVEYFGE